MWQALGQVYENTDRRAEALQVYERALHAPENGGDSPLAILHRLAMLAQALGRFLEAARWTEAMLGEAQRTGRPEAEMAQGWLFLARYEVGAFDGHAGEGEREQQGGVGRRREPNWALAAHYLQTIVRQVRLLRALLPLLRQPDPLTARLSLLLPRVPLCSRVRLDRTSPSGMRRSLSRSSWMLGKPKPTRRSRSRSLPEQHFLHDRPA